jgi:hypothetical protein
MALESGLFFVKEKKKNAEKKGSYWSGCILQIYDNETFMK